MDEPVLQQAEQTGDGSILARYSAHPKWWTDVREALPRCRVKVADGENPVIVEVKADRTLDAPDRVIVDLYPDDPDMRDEEVNV